MRIIAGRWRGRRIPVPALDGVRPTGDRVRETLFNWLAPHLPGARCLDLFAGTGVLGLEALSRDAAAVCFVDLDRRALDGIARMLETFDCRSAELVCAGAGAYLRRAPQPFDIVFLDPPFADSDPGELCTLLAAGWLNPGAWVYLEMNSARQLPPLPAGWSLHRESSAGQVRFALARVAG